MKNSGQNISGCRVCGSHNVAYLCDTFNDFSDTKTLHHFRCRECGSVFVGNDIDKEEIGTAYSSLESKPYYEEIESENRKKMANAIENLKGLISKNDSIIDIGTGNGLFIELLHSAGFENIFAHEIQGSDLSNIKGIAKDVFLDFDYSSIPSDNFNAVTMLDVAEHVPDPKYLFNMCARILKRNGIIYFHTPVVTKTDRVMHFLQKIPVVSKVGRIWQRGRTTVHHLENYTPKSLMLLLTGAGFRDIHIEIKNELTWPLTRYVRVYLFEKQGWPGFLAPAVVPFFYPLLATNLLNANKAIVSAAKA